MKNEQKQRQNEQKFGAWEELADGGRCYSYEVTGRYGWSARYFKEVDKSEQTVRFWQEIYDENGQLAEIHEKYPVDKGHINVRENKK